MKTLLLLCAILFSACHETREEHAERLVKEWQEKEIKFPENPVFTRFVNDTVDYRIPISNYKVVSYIDSLGCISCKLQLPKWKELIAQVDSLSNGTVPFLFYCKEIAGSYRFSVYSS